MNKKKIASLSLSLALSAGIFSGLTVQAEQYYPDVDENHWAYEWVGYMNEKGYIHGYPDGDYRPAQNITRAEYVTILNFMFNSTGTTNNNYSDVKEGDWFYNGIHAAVAAGYLHGYDDATDIDDGTMKPNNYITREEAAVIAAGAYDLKLNSDVSKFSDADQISSWAVPYVGALAGGEVLMGDLESAFNPKDYMSRAEVATMLARTDKAINEGKLEQNVKVTLPAAMTNADSIYTMSDITTQNAKIEDTFALNISVSENGNVGAYKINISVGDVSIADGVNLEGLETALENKSFTAEELEKLSVQFVDFTNPADGSSLKINVKVTDFATGNTIYDSKDYVIAFGEQSVEWPNVFGKDSNTAYTLSGIKTDYSSDMILNITEKSNVSVGDYTLTVKSGNTIIADNVTLEELLKILAEKKLTPEEANALTITVSAPSASNNATLTLTMSFKDAESGDIVGSAKDYTITFTKSSGSPGTIQGGSSTEVSSTRDRVKESLEDYQGDLTNSSSSKAIADDYRKHRISDDMLKVILTNDGMVTFDAAVSQTKDAKNVESAFNTLKNDLGDTVDGASCFDKLYPVYEDVIKYVLASDKVTYKADDISTDNKEKYVLLFRAMVETINGSAKAAIKVYNENPTLDANGRFEKFKTEATNNATAALSKHLTDSFDANEKLNITNLAGSYCQELFEANSGNSSLRDDLTNAGTLTLSNFTNILLKYLIFK